MSLFFVPILFQNIAISHAGLINWFAKICSVDLSNFVCGLASIVGVHSVVDNLLEINNLHPGTYEDNKN